MTGKTRGFPLFAPVMVIKTTSYPLKVLNILPPLSRFKKTWPRVIILRAQRGGCFVLIFCFDSVVIRSPYWKISRTASCSTTDLVCAGQGWRGAVALCKTATGAQYPPLPLPRCRRLLGRYPHISGSATAAPLPSLARRIDMGIGIDTRPQCPLHGGGLRFQSGIG